MAPAFSATVRHARARTPAEGRIGGEACEQRRQSRAVLDLEGPAGRQEGPGDLPRSTCGPKIGATPRRGLHEIVASDGREAAADGRRPRGRRARKARRAYREGGRRRPAAGTALGSIEGSALRRRQGRPRIFKISATRSNRSGRRGARTSMRRPRGRGGRASNASSRAVSSPSAVLPPTQISTSPWRSERSGGPSLEGRSPGPEGGDPVAPALLRSALGPGTAARSGAAASELQVSRDADSRGRTLSEKGEALGVEIGLYACEPHGAEDATRGRTRR